MFKDCYDPVFFLFSQHRAAMAMVVEGDISYQVSPAGAIPAFNQPVFIQGDDADAQLQEVEMILGLDNGAVKANSR